MNLLRMSVDKRCVFRLNKWVMDAAEIELGIAAPSAPPAAVPRRLAGARARVDYRRRMLQLSWQRSVRIYDT